jgi:hypothetical protein
MFKAPIKVLHPLLTATQEGNYVGTEAISAIPFSGIILAHSNESEWLTFRNNKNNEAFLDRICVIKVPYCLRVDEEQKIYEKMVSHSGLAESPCAPKTVEMLAQFCILTRLHEHDNSTLVSKMRVYNGENIREQDPKAKSIQEYRDVAGIDEGMNGISTRFAYKILSQTFSANINTEKRASTANNHSATHLLHQALREILGTHVEQKGSLVNPDYLRFDFSHFSKVTDEELAHVENRVNALIKEKLVLQEFRNIPIDEAKSMGAMALFGEKYGDEVRAIKFGQSIELCGGTHVSNTGNIGVFKITTETAVAAGIRRIEAISGEKAMEMFKTKAATYDEISTMFNKPKNLTATIEDLIVKNQELLKTIERLNKDKAQSIKQELKNKFVEKDGYLLLAEKVHLDAGGIKDILFQFKSDLNQPFVAIIGGIDGEKASLNIMISESLVAEKSYNAGALVKEHAKHINGGGGGQNFFATAGGKNPNGLDAAIQAVISAL